MSESQHVGPIIFADETARRQLVEEGEVVTARASERTTGDTWWRESRTGPKQGNVHVEHVTTVETGAVVSSVLPRYADVSGFGDPVSWHDAIVDLNGELPIPLHFYRATLRD